MCLFNAARMIVKGLLVSAMLLSSCPFLWFPCVLPAIAYGSSSDNPIYASYTINCHSKYSYRSRLGRRKMPIMTKQRKRENRETMSVVKAQVTICPYMNFPAGTVLARFTARQNRRQKVVNRRALRLCMGAWHSNLTKLPTIHSVSYNIISFIL